MIKPLVPETVTPLCDSVVVHIFVSSLYGLIDKIIPAFRYVLKLEISCPYVVLHYIIKINSRTAGESQYKMYILSSNPMY